MIRSINGAGQLLGNAIFAVIMGGAAVVLIA
jgi:hypothetical protein